MHLTIMKNKILKYCKESEILSSVQNVERLYIKQNKRCPFTFFHRENTYQSLRNCHGGHFVKYLRPFYLSCAKRQNSIQNHESIMKVQIYTQTHRSTLTHRQTDLHTHTYIHTDIHTYKTIEKINIIIAHIKCIIFIKERIGGLEHKESRWLSCGLVIAGE